ncbi:Endonuclease/exonuclease/phosphatase [Dipodascopsis uninucleata]
MAKASTEKKSGGRPDFVTPEYIAAQRAKREQAKLEKKKRNKELGIIPEKQFSLDFIKRPYLPVNLQTSDDASHVDIRIMTYNVLGQALIRRKLFPTNGDILKWKWRSKILLSEFAYYSADLMCLQEVDFAHLESFYYPRLQELGYETIFHRGDRKNHGLLIAYKAAMFTLDRTSTVDYDNDVGACENNPKWSSMAYPQTKTRNVGLLAYLKFKSAEDKGLIIGTTHLFWHPYGTYERTRQSAILVRNALKFLSDIGNHVPVFLAGDFNSLPYHSAYLSLTKTKNNRVTDESTRVLQESVEHVYARNAVEEDEDGEDGNDSIDEGGEMIDTKKASDISAGTEMTTDELASSVTDNSFPITPSVSDVYKLFDENGILLKSAYGEFYRYVHPGNADVEKRNGESSFSNWAHAWRGLIDYIFVLDSQEESNKRNESSLTSGVDVLELLRMPTPEEMGSEPSGQPREGQYPSDHLCLVCKFRIFL